MVAVIGLFWGVADLDLTGTVEAQPILDTRLRDKLTEAEMVDRPLPKSPMGLKYIIPK